MIKCPICSSLYYDLQASICSQCGYNFNSSTAAPQDDNSVTVENQTTQIGTIEEKLEPLTKTTSEIKNQLEKTNQAIYNLAKHVQKLANDNLSVKNQLIQLQIQEQESTQKILLLEKKLAQGIFQFPEGHESNFIENAIQGLNLEMVYIPSGEFMMGSNSSEDEKPVHQVEIKEFHLGKYPITQAQYQMVMGENTSDFEGANNPVECVSWNDAQEFCRRLSELSGKQYLLPTEAQWEYACRAGNTGEWCFGNDENNLQDYGWYHVNSNRKTHPVGLKKPNAWGLYDMHGNVWEWCQDEYVENYKNTPRDGSAKTSMSVLSKNSIHYTVLRGGSWFISSFYCRSAKRTRATYDSISSDVGFRVMCVIPFDS